jgi:hypothetical protein
VLALASDGRAASKIKIAAIGDQAPGGGQFLGPSLTGAPAAAGNGWVAFRTLVTEGGTSEQIVVTKLAGQPERHVVAALGQSAGKRGGKGLGTFKQFLGRPTVNANGDVAFVAALTNSEAIPGGFEHLGEAQPAGVFLYRRSAPRGERLKVVAAARDVVPGLGGLDLTPADEQTEGSAIDVLKRTPGLDDAGDVAFVAATFDEDTLQSSGAIFLGRVGASPVPLVRYGTPFAEGALTTLGPPALNNAGMIAFRGTVESDTDSVDGIFRWDGTTLVRLAKDFDLFVPPGDPLNAQQPFGFGELVSMNDAGDVAFTAGGMLDLVSFSSSDFEFGVLVARGTDVRLVSYPGLAVEGFGRIRGTELGPDGGGEVATPSMRPDGSVDLFAELTGGNGQAFFHARPPDYALVVPIVVFGGTSPDSSPVGGFYFAAESGPASDARGNLTFFARLAGAPVNEALIFSGSQNRVVVGEATPTKGRFGGPPFSAPVIGDDDTVLFKSFMAAGPSALGIFRWRPLGGGNTEFSVLVRTGDAAPLEGAPLILDLPGEASLNARGEVAFAASVAGRGRGAFALGPEGIRKIALPNDPVPPGPPDAQLESVATNPLMLADGSVIFRGSFAYEDPILFSLVREEALFRVDPAGTMTFLARTGQDSPTGTPFFRFRDPSTSGSFIVFRAPLGQAGTLDPDALPVGLFLIDPAGAIRTLIMQNDPIGNGTALGTLTGRPAVDSAGNVGFLGRVGAAERTTLVHQTMDGTRTVLATVGEGGPAGGTVRSVGRPTMSTSGHTAFRASFEKGGGGTSGFLLATDGTPQPFVQIGESDDLGAGGRIVSLAPTAALNARDHLVFVGSVSAGSSRNALFMASPTTAQAEAVRLRLRDRDVNGLPTTFGSARGRLTLGFGDLGRAIKERKAGLEGQAVTVSVADASGTLFTATAGKGALARSGGGFVLKGRGGFRRLQVRPIGKTGARVAFTTAAQRSAFRDFNRIVPPLSLRVDVGAHSGTAVLPCRVGDGTADCGS